MRKINKENKIKISYIQKLYVKKLLRTMKENIKTNKEDYKENDKEEQKLRTTILTLTEIFDIYTDHTQNTKITEKNINNIKIEQLIEILQESIKELEKIA